MSCVLRLSHRLKYILEIFHSLTKTLVLIFLASVYPRYLIVPHLTSFLNCSKIEIKTQYVYKLTKQEEKIF